MPLRSAGAHPPLRGPPGLGAAVRNPEQAGQEPGTHEQDQGALALRCAVLCGTVLCCAVLYCAVLCFAVLCCALLCCTVLCCAVLCCVLGLQHSLGGTGPRSLLLPPWRSSANTVLAHTLDLVGIVLHRSFWGRCWKIRASGGHADMRLTSTTLWSDQYHFALWSTIP